MTLEEAIKEIENDLTNIAYTNGNARAFVLVIYAARCLLKEHGNEYITEQSCGMNR